MVYQQDDASIHRSMSTMIYLKSKNVQVLNWPYRNPNLNTIENLEAYYFVMFTEMLGNFKQLTIWKFQLDTGNFDGGTVEY